MDAATRAGLVVFVSHHATIIGGGEISLLTLIKGLGATGWEPLLVVPEDGAVAAGARDLGVEVRYADTPTLRRPNRGLLRAVRGIRALVRELQPAVVHANGSRAMFYGGLGARARGCPAVWHLRIIDPDPLLDPLLVRLADATIANSAATRGRLRPWPAAWERCRVVPNGLDIDAFRPARSRRDTRAELGLAEDDLVLVMVSRLVDFKRHDLLLDAIAELRAHEPHLRCVIVGDGPEQAALQAQTTRLGLTDVVRFAGHREDVADMLQAADLFVLSSAEESFGRVLIEAMALGRPVVAAAAGGPAEIIEDGVSGLLVEAGDAAALAEGIRTLCNDAALRARLGAGGRARVEARYSMEAHTRAVVEVYDEICAHPGVANE